MNIPASIVAIAAHAAKSLFPWLTRFVSLCCVLCASVAFAQAPRQAGQAFPNQAPRPVARTAPITAPFELTPPQEKYLNDVLNYWEFRSSQIQRYRCRFTRFVYDPKFGPQDRFTAKTQSTGAIMYASPDKGLFKIEKITHYNPPRQEGAPPVYLEQPGEFGEHWVCDGNSVFEYNFEKKQLVQRELPPNMRGKAIAEGPLPFLFGAKANVLRQRYWLRIITPVDVKGEYWLEAFPKTRGDAAQFKKIEVILDEKDYLPKAIQVFDTNYDERRNPSRTVFVFEDREVNWNKGLAAIKEWMKGQFYQPTVPQGWKKVVEPYPIDEPMRAAQAPPRQGPSGQTQGGQAPAGQRR